MYLASKEREVKGPGARKHLSLVKRALQSRTGSLEKKSWKSWGRTAGRWKGRYKRGAFLGKESMSLPQQ